jgi:hypothetical protein
MPSEICAPGRGAGVPLPADCRAFSVSWPGLEPRRVRVVVAAEGATVLDVVRGAFAVAQGAAGVEAAEAPSRGGPPDHDVRVMQHGRALDLAQPLSGLPDAAGGLELVVKSVPLGGGSGGGGLGGSLGGSAAASRQPSSARGASGGASVSGGGGGGEWGGGGSGGRKPTLGQLAREGYRTVPPMEELRERSDEELRAVRGFQVVREDPEQGGAITARWREPVDLRRLDLSRVLRLEHGGLLLYAADGRHDEELAHMEAGAPEERLQARRLRAALECVTEPRPRVGQGLNRRYLVEISLGAGLSRGGVEEAHEREGMPGAFHDYNERTGIAAFSFEPY